MGRAVSFQDYTRPSWYNITYEGRPYSRLLYSILDAFGLQPADYADTFKPQNNNVSTERFMTLNDWQTKLPYLKSRTA
jgi:hypothetical protein